MEKSIGKNMVDLTYLSLLWIGGFVNLKKLSFVETTTCRNLKISKRFANQNIFLDSIM